MFILSGPRHSAEHHSNETRYYCVRRQLCKKALLLREKVLHIPDGTEEERKGHVYVSVTDQGLEPKPFDSIDNP